MVWGKYQDEGRMWEGEVGSDGIECRGVDSAVSRHSTISSSGTAFIKNSYVKRTRALAYLEPK